MFASKGELRQRDDFDYSQQVCPGGFSSAIRKRRPFKSDLPLTEGQESSKYQLSAYISSLFTGLPEILPERHGSPIERSGLLGVLEGFALVFDKGIGKAI